MLGIRATMLALTLAAALALAGCGGGDEGGAEEWASSVCSEVSGWVTEVDSTVQTLTDEGLGIEETDLMEASDSVGEATDELGAALEELGPPEIEEAQQAQAEVQTLIDGLREQYEAAQSALTANLAPLETVSRIATAIAAAVDQLQESIANLEELDPAGELADGFRDSDDCEALRERIAEIGS